NLSDSLGFYIGEIDFHSDNINVILKGDRLPSTLSTIKIEEKSGLDGKINTLSLSLLPELSIGFPNTLNITQENFEAPGNVINKINFGQIIEEPYSITIPLINELDSGDVILINGLIYENKSDFDDPSIISHLRLTLNENNYIMDALPSCLTSVVVNSQEENKIIYNGPNINFRISDIIVSNDILLYNIGEIELIGPGDFVSLEVPQGFGIKWSDVILDNLSIIDR
ncbi:uncharacterized protein METZ01_LOCUS428694, partial [marine metagenome]